MTLEYCKTCGKDTWNPLSKPHVCHAPWLAWDSEEEGREDAREVHAFDPSDAAEAWADETDREYDEYQLHDRTVCVVPAAQPDAEPERFVVSTEVTVVYSARPA